LNRRKSYKAKTIIMNTDEDQSTVEPSAASMDHPVPPVVHGDDDEFIDDTPEFINMQDVVEVQVDDDLPMEDDDDDDDQDETDAMGPQQTTGETSSSSSVPTVTEMSQFQLRSHTDSVYTVAAFVEDGKLSILSGGGDDKAFQYKIDGTSNTNPTDSSTPPVLIPTVQNLPYDHTDTVSSVAYNLAYVSEDLKKTPRLAAVGSFDGSIVIYDPDTSAQILKLEGPTDVEWLSFHPKGGSVLLAGSSSDGTLWMFHIPLNRCLQVFVGHEQAVTAGGFSPDGRWALSASADGTLRIWAPKTGMSKHVFRLGEAGLTCMGTNGGSDSMLVMVGSEDGQAHVCHIGTKKVVATLRHFEMPSNPMSSEEDDVEYPTSVEAVGFYPAQPNWCATGGVDGKLKIWDLARDGQCRQVCIPPQLDFEEAEGEEQQAESATLDSITRLLWHPSLPVVFTAYVSGSLRLWDARNGTLIHTLTGSVEQINDMDIQFLPNGAAVIVTASDDKTVRVFNLDVNTVMQNAGAAPPNMQ
jgi:WD40 repeat protein